VRRQSRGEAPAWQSAGEGKRGELADALVALKMATKQIAAVGSPAQITQTVQILVDARRRLYELLAKG
jgi:hypothetical protein